MAGKQGDFDCVMEELKQKLPPGFDKLLEQLEDRLSSFERTDRRSHYVEGMKVGVKLVAYLLLT